MALSLLKGLKRTNQNAASATRSQIRSLLRKASRGNVFAYTQAASHYVNLISAYLYLCGATERGERLQEIRSVLAECWRYLPYTRRVSDFERFLQIQLGKRGEASADFAAPHEHLGKLSHEERFLLVARVFENWSYKSLRLSLRRSHGEISSALFSTKSKSIGFKPRMLKTHEQLLAMRVSDLTEGQLSPKAALKVEQDVARHYHVLQFKADWLSYRSDLIELSLETKLTLDEQKGLNDEIHEQLKQEKMEQPSLRDAIINQFSFTRMPVR